MLSDYETSHREFLRSLRSGGGSNGMVAGGRRAAWVGRRWRDRMITMRIVFSTVALAALVVGCRSVEAPSAGPRPPVSAASLVGTSWVAEDIDGMGVLERVQSTLTFAGSQQIAGRAACNQFFGSLEVGDGTLRLKPAGTTRMACPPAVMEQETRFLKALGVVTSFRREAGKLLLLDGGGAVRVRLAPLAPERGAAEPGSNKPTTASAAGPLRAHTFDSDTGSSESVWA